MVSFLKRETGGVASVRERYQQNWSAALVVACVLHNPRVLVFFKLKILVKKL